MPCLTNMVSVHVLSLLFRFFIRWGDGCGFFLQNNYSTRPFWIRDDYSQHPVKRLVGFVSSHIQHALVKQLLNIPVTFFHKVREQNMPTSGLCYTKEDQVFYKISTKRSL